MPNIKEILIAAILPAIKAVGQLEVADLLEKLDAKEGDMEFAADIKGGYNLFVRLRAEAQHTKTKIDDGLLDFIIAAIEEKAKSSGITL